MVAYSNRLFKTYLHHLYLSEQGSFTLFLWYFSTLRAWVHKHHLCFQMYPDSIWVYYYTSSFIKSTIAFILLILVGPLKHCSKWPAFSKLFLIHLFVSTTC